MSEIVACPKEDYTGCVERQECYAHAVGMGEYCVGTFKLIVLRPIAPNPDPSSFE